MTFAAQALSINVTALKKHLPNVAENPAIPGQTDPTYNGFGLKENSATCNDVAYFFADYAKDNNTKTGVNIVLNSENASSGGYKLAQDIIARAGDNGYLEEDELQAWADEIGFTGEIKDVMQTMSEMDKWLYGEGTLELVPEDEIPTSDSTTSDERTPDETTPDETTPEEPSTPFLEPNDNSLADVVGDTLKGVGSWLWEGAKGIGSWLWEGAKGGLSSFIG